MTGPCRHLVDILGAVRCRQPEDSPIHDPLNSGSHVYEGDYRLREDGHIESIGEEETKP